jgi:hypothetical protein
MAEDLGRVPPGVDARRANVARVYDYLLGGTHNFLPDQDSGRALVAVDPNAPAAIRANRAFTGRAVRFLGAAGIRQFLDIGSGIPARGSVHEVAQAVDPAARVANVDIDPVVTAHSRAILADPATGRRLDLSRPAGLLLVAVLHFISDADDPWQIVATLRDALAPGSYLVLCHATHESRPDVARAAETVYNRSASTDAHLRSRADIGRFFDGFALVDPGLVYIPLWRPDSPQDVPGDPSRCWGLGGVGRKR